MTFIATHCYTHGAHYLSRYVLSAMLNKTNDLRNLSRSAVTEFSTRSWLLSFVLDPARWNERPTALLPVQVCMFLNESHSMCVARDVQLRNSRVSLVSSFGKRSTN